MKVTGHLNKLLNNNEKNIKSFEEKINLLFANVRNKGSEIAYDYALFGELNHCVYNLRSSRSMDMILVFLDSTFDAFITQFIQPKFKVDDKLTIPNIETYIDTWKIMSKVHSWLRKLFKAMHETTFHHPEDDLMTKFKTNIVEQGEIKKQLCKYVVEELEKAKSDQASEAAGENSKTPPQTPAHTIIKSFVELSYSLQSFDEEFKNLASNIFMEAEAEYIKKIGPPQEAPRMSSSYMPSSTSMYTYNDYPYKEHFVGLKNQGSLCYLNSLIQVLYNIPAFRRIVFQWRYNKAIHGDEEYCILFQLQHLFARLRMSEMKAIETVNLTKSFGWERSQSFEQQDSTEFMRVLFETLINEKLPIEEIFEGEYSDYVICSKCCNIGGRKTKFLDLQLPVRGLKHLDASIAEFQFEECLSGVNQYFCEKCNCKVDAKKGIKLLRTPDILSLHLKRFDIDYTTFSRIKLNNQLVFPHVLDMNKYVNSAASFTSNELDVESLEAKYNIYTLQSVVIHSGSAGGGHYYSYEKVGNHWYEFNDSTVTKIEESQVEKAFGSGSSHSNGYLLIYIRDEPISQAHRQLLEMTDEQEIETIPLDIRKAIATENENYLKGQRAYEFKKKKLEFTVLFDTIKQIPTEFLSSNVETLLSDIDFKNSRQNLYLEKDDGEYLPEEHVSIFVSKFAKDSFDKPSLLTVKRTASLADIKQSIESLTSIPASRQTIIATKFVNNTPKNYLMVEDDDLMLENGDKIYVEENIDIESDVHQESKALENLLTIQNTISLTVENSNKEKFPITIDRRQPIYLLKDLVSQILNKEAETFTLAFGDSSPEDMHILDNLDDKISFHLFSGSTVRVVEQHQLVKPTFKLTFYMEEPVEHHHPSNHFDHYELDHRMMLDMDYCAAAYPNRPMTRGLKRAAYNMLHAPEMADAADIEHMSITTSRKHSKDIIFEDEHGKPIHASHRRGNKFKKLFDLTLDKETSVKEIKEFIFNKAKEEKSDIIKKKDTSDNVRVRERLDNRDYAGRILRDEEKPFYSLSGSNGGNSSSILSTSSRQVIIERQDQTSIITSEDVVIRVARFKPSSWSMSAIREIIIQKRTCNLFQLKQIILGLDDKISEEHLKLVKIPHQLNSYLRDTNYMMKLSWNSNLSDESLVCQDPWFVTDCDMILYKDDREQIPDYILENGTLNGDEHMPAAARGSNGSKPSRDHEQGIRFRTKEEIELKRKNLAMDNNGDALNGHDMTDDDPDDTYHNTTGRGLGGSKKAKLC
ncbi:hypothetical protein C9374_006380 [Naegleria lovaniensis]|uniref:USP domain-containing protein n=1 Tax=Naegleria lovaniensis TaxID=51637 RepID=A0AA88GI51_NAELO|nr:uncharacterized protein C9374_006380 [Naegleria lovaniensis]KAG2381391.1 hypothetical protein C9374_006380 [Naegleria lovaniensis]